MHPTPRGRGGAQCLVGPSPQGPQFSMARNFYCDMESCPRKSKLVRQRSYGAAGAVLPLEHPYPLHPHPARRAASRRPAAGGPPNSLRGLALRRAPPGPASRGRELLDLEGLKYPPRRRESSPSDARPRPSQPGFVWGLPRHVSRQRRGPPLWDGGAESSPGTLRGAGRKRNLPGRPTRRTRRTRPTRPTRSSSRNAATTYDIPTMSLCEVNPSERVRGTISEVRGYRVDILESISGAGIARAPAIAAAVAAMLPPRATFLLSG